MLLILLFMMLLRVRQVLLSVALVQGLLLGRLQLLRWLLLLEVMASGHGLTPSQVPCVQEHAVSAIAKDASGSSRGSKRSSCGTQYGRWCRVHGGHWQGPMHLHR